MKLEPYVVRAMQIFNGSFINYHNELILDSKLNIYFKLDDIENELDFNIKIIAYVSRYTIKGSNPRKEKEIREKFNQYFEIKFSIDDLQEIYTYLGNGCNKSLAKMFIISGYDMGMF